MPDDKPRPSSGARSRRVHQEQQPAAPDPADLGTAYGMEISMEGSGVPGQAGPEEDDPLQWIRRWLDRHKQTPR